MSPERRFPLKDGAQAGFTGRVVAAAVEAARRAGAIQMQAFRSGSVSCTKQLHDIKAETDRHCEAVIIEVIRNAFPDHAILSEESGLLPGEGEYTWIVDPLDGTVNFWHGIPFFCVSIACYCNDGGLPEPDSPPIVSSASPLAGVIFMPVSREMFVGLAGLGAWLNGRTLRRRHMEKTGDMVVSMSFGKTPDVMQQMTRRLDTILPKVRKARCLGAAAAELAYAAAGFLGAVVYEGIKFWDFAAAKILVEETGGFLEAVETSPGMWRVLAGVPAARALLEELLSI